jgi:hypothetical protein
MSSHDSNPVPCSKCGKEILVSFLCLLPGPWHDTRLCYDCAYDYLTKEWGVKVNHKSTPVKGVKGVYQWQIK